MAQIQRALLVLTQILLIALFAAITGDAIAAPAEAGATDVQQKLRAIHELAGHRFVDAKGHVDDTFLKKKFPLVTSPHIRRTPKERQAPALGSAIALFAKMGVATNGKISHANFIGGDLLYPLLDVDNRGFITLDDVEEFRKTAPYANARRKAVQMIAKFDRNKDKLLSKTEFVSRDASKWFGCDANKDGLLARTEIAQCLSSRAKERRARSRLSSRTAGSLGTPLVLAALPTIPAIDWLCVAGAPWRADYFSASDYKQLETNPDLAPYATECLMKLERNYASKPMPKSGSDPVVVRFKGMVDLPKGGIYEVDYRFDGKAIIKVDGEYLPLLLGPTAEEAYSGKQPNYKGAFKWSFKPGKHSVTAYYFGAVSPGYASLGFKLVKEVNYPVPPEAIVCKAGQWKAFFYNQTNSPLLASKPALVRCDDAVDFTWTASTSPGPGVNNKGWSVRWERAIRMKAGEKRQFELSSYPSAMVKVDGQSIIDLWSPPEAFLYGSYTAKTAKWVTVEVQYSTVDASQEENWRVRLASQDCTNAPCSKKQIVNIKPNAQLAMLNSRPVLENIGTKIDVMDGKEPTGATTTLPHKTDYTWNFNGGSDATSVRFHFTKLDLSGQGNKLVLFGDDSNDAQTLTGKPSNGLSNSVSGNVAYLRLVTESASQTAGFAVDRVEVTRVDSGQNVLKGLGETNQEWVGYMKPGQTTAYSIAINETGLHDFFAQVPSGGDVGICVREGLTSPTFKSCAGSVGQATSKVVSLNVDSPHYFTIVLRNNGATTTPYTFMVNRVANVFDIEVEFDWTVPADKIAAKQCQLEQLFRRSSERFYGMTDGFMRFGTVKYWLQSCWAEAVDA